MQVAAKNTRQRQSPITEESLDVVSGFEALGGRRYSKWRM
jgi:F0F1-type ATP synthase gamma subunit